MSWVDPHDCEICMHPKASHHDGGKCSVQFRDSGDTCPCERYIELNGDSTSTAAARLLGSKGGKSTAAKMTDEQRRARAQNAAAARWTKRDEK